MWNGDSDVDEAFRQKVIWGSAAIVVIGLLVAGYYYKYHTKSVPLKVESSRPPPVPEQVATEPAVHNPVPVGQPDEAKSLPLLKESDHDVRESLVGLLGLRAVERFIVPENIVRHIVVTIDNMPRKKVAVELRPVKPTAGTTATTSQGDVMTLGAANYERYAPIIKLVQTTDTKTLADVYFRMYPLFQQSYEDLGYPGQYFNDRLVEVIDDLLQTPDVQGPVELTQPKVFYEYADPKLEARSAGQKLLIRMGPANEALLKVKLRELRKAVASRPDEPATH